MRETTGTMTMFKIVLGFTLLFAAFLAVAITYNKVFRIKNETLSILEKYEGVNDKSLVIINNYLKESGYDIKGKCESGEYGVADLTNDDYELAMNNKDYYYCLSNYCQGSSCNINDSSLPNGNLIYYKLKFFFKFNIPIIGELATFKITGDTKGIKLYTEGQKLS